MNEKIIKITIKVGDQEKEFRGDYFDLHNREWEDIIRGMLDDEHFTGENAL